jgi:hypothetical protein
MAKAQNQPTGSDVDALIAEVEAARASATAATGPGASALPPGTEDIIMAVFLWLLNWWKSRNP